MRAIPCSTVRRRITPDGTAPSNTCTCAQSRSHFFRQVNGRPHLRHTLLSRSAGGQGRLIRFVGMSSEDRLRRLRIPLARHLGGDLANLHLRICEQQTATDWKVRADRNGNSRITTQQQNIIFYVRCIRDFPFLSALILSSQFLLSAPSLSSQLLLSAPSLSSQLLLSAHIPFSFGPDRFCANEHDAVDAPQRPPCRLRSFHIPSVVSTALHPTV